MNILSKVEEFNKGEISSIVVCDGDGEMTFAPENIESRLTTSRPILPAEPQNLMDEVEKEQQNKADSGENYSWNWPNYALEKHLILRTDINEDMKVVFTFAPSDYYTFKAINKDLNKILADGQ